MDLLEGAEGEGGVGEQELGEEVAEHAVGTVVRV